MEYQHFLNVFIEILNKYAPMKQKYLRANKRIFITKELLKKIMKRSKFCAIGQKYIKRNTKTNKTFAKTF